VSTPDAIDSRSSIQDARLLFVASQVVVRSGKGDRDRVTLLPAAVRPALRRHLERVRVQHERDLLVGAGWMELPGAPARKYPNAGSEWPWQWEFPATYLTEGEE
jgi:hypothetical protein